MKLRELISKFEDGMNMPDIYMQHKTKGQYFKLAFDNDGEEFRDVYVYEAKTVVLDEEVSAGTFVYPKGAELLVEVNYETPTLYGHEMGVEQLFSNLETNFRMTNSRAFIGNTDCEWEYLEHLL